jgi:hypothetical protein
LSQASSKLEATVTQRIVAVAPLTEAELSLLGEGFERAFPMDETPSFIGLLEAIADAYREFRVHAWKDRPKT